MVLVETSMSALDDDPRDDVSTVLSRAHTHLLRKGKETTTLRLTQPIVSKRQNEVFFVEPSMSIGQKNFRTHRSEQR